MSKISILLKSVIWLFVSWLASGVIIMFFPFCYESFGVIMCIAFGICSVGATVCLFADFAHKCGGKMRLSTDTEEQIKKQQHFGWFLGIAPTVINYIYVIVLWLSKFGVIKTDFYPLYKTLNFYFVPLTYLFAPNSAVYIDGRAVSVPMAASELSIAAMIFFSILPIVFVLTTWIAYYLGYNHISLKEKIVYRR